ncbi:GNAT family N-acetyltransferase [Pseudohongiella spirulinae]|uniref:Acetyltransferase, GNAT family n=1 Tax=Pseudohongiella spirulinae TaxID=1249552 RepID=A0A0S2KBS1_9GAMM|nr:GNAT family N-acetyltransferase [Pseudohongiella spirulinae]ALO45741.1 Acetyltransferase, GNAT family [Pseudohongiella spirulinae]
MTDSEHADKLFETERLCVRRWRESDLPAIFAVYSDAEAMRWVGDGSPITEEGCRQWMQITQNNYVTRGYGMCTVELKGSREIIGFCGIVHPGGQPEAEIKYAFMRSVWGQGFATEAATALLEYAFASLGIHYVIATTAPENAASHRVLLKAGMQRGELQDNEDGTQTQVFFISRPSAPPPPASA